LFKEEKEVHPFASLLDGAKSRDLEAISLVYRQFLPGVFAYIFFRVPDRNTAEDLTSDVFVHMVERIHKVKATDEATFAAWLFQIARTTVAGYYRGRGRMPVSLQEDADLMVSPSPDPAHYVEDCEDRSALVQAINMLTEEQRQVLIGRLLLEYDVGTVARMIGKNVNAVRALQFRALQSLKRILSKRGDRHEITS
jgi:RNA polymerase sigma-70 factor, ECF subfamily